MPLYRSERKRWDVPVEYVEKGSEIAGAEPGDFLLTHRPGLLPNLISLAESRRYGGAGHWSHSALVVSAANVIESERGGVIVSPISKYRDSSYAFVRSGRLMSESGRRAAVEYAEEQLGKAFGYLVLASVGIWLLTGVRAQFARRDHQICSSLVAHALEQGGLDLGDDPTFLLPADLAEIFAAPQAPERARAR